MAVNYIEEREAFYDWLTMNHLSANAQSLWNALFTICNKQRWPDGFFKVPTMTLLSYTHCSHDALLDARQQLKNKGLIDFIKGNRRSDAASYKLVFLSSVYSNRVFCPEIADKTEGKGTDKEAYKPADKPADIEATKPADVYKHYANLNKTGNKTAGGDACAHAREDNHVSPLLSETEMDTLGRKHMDDMQAIESRAKQMGMAWALADEQKAEALIAEYTVKWLLEAMNRAAGGQASCRSWRYIEAILKAWKKNGGPDSDSKPFQHVGKRVEAQNYTQRQYPEIDMNNWAAKMISEAAPKESAAQ